MDRPLPNLSSFPLPAQAWLRAYLFALGSEPPLSARSRADLAELTLRQYANAQTVHHPASEVFTDDADSGQGDNSSGRFDSLGIPVGELAPGVRPPFPDWGPED